MYAEAVMKARACKLKSNKTKFGKHYENHNAVVCCDISMQLFHFGFKFVSLHALNCYGGSLLSSDCFSKSTFFTKSFRIYNQSPSCLNLYLLWVQNVCKCYQQTRIKSIMFQHCICASVETSCLSSDWFKITDWFRLGK